MSDSQEFIAYPSDVFSLKEHMGKSFIPKFIETYNLNGLKKKIEESVAISKEKNKRTPIISFCSEKGGCGKSTLTLCVSQVVANMGYRVLIIDTDRSSSSDVTNARRAIISSEIEMAEKQSIPVEAVLEYKYGTEPVVEAISVLPSNFNAAFVLELAEKNEYDLIVIDTPGLRQEDLGNFDIREFRSTGKPHLTSSYVSNVTIIPTGTSNIDLTRMISFTQPFLAFIGAMGAMNMNIVKNQYGVFANCVEKTGRGLKELESAKEDLPFNFFKTSMRRSEKISSNTSQKHSTTVLSNNTVKHINIGFIELVDEIYDLIFKSLEA